MGAPPKSDDPIATPDVLAQADGVVFGLPTRFGMVAAQVKAFMDSTGGLWATCVPGPREVALACRRRALIHDVAAPSQGRAGREAGGRVCFDGDSGRRPGRCRPRVARAARAYSAASLESQETTALTFVTQLAHHGMLFVPVGYAHPKRTAMDEMIGGSPCACCFLAARRSAAHVRLTVRAVPFLRRLGHVRRRGRLAATIQH